MQTSAGLLMYRRGAAGVEVLLAHPGGPFFARKDEGYWGIPKGLIDDGEATLDAARREFAEETSIALSDGTYLELGEVKLKSSKVVYAWAFEGDCDPAAVVSNTFEIEWPPRTGQRKRFPEIDRAEWFPIEAARRMMNAAQTAFLDRLLEQLGV